MKVAKLVFTEEIYREPIPFDILDLPRSNDHSPDGLLVSAQLWIRRNAPFPSRTNQTEKFMNFAKLNGLESSKGKVENVEEQANKGESSIRSSLPNKS